MALDDGLVVVAFLHLIPIFVFGLCGNRGGRIDRLVLILLIGSFLSDVITTIVDQYNWNTTPIGVAYSLLEYYCFYRLIIRMTEKKGVVARMSRYCLWALLLLAPIVLWMGGEHKSIAIFWMIENAMIVLLSVYLLFRITGLENETQIEFNAFRILLIYFCYTSIFFIPSIAFIFVDSYPKSKKWYEAYWIFAMAANLTRDVLFSIYFMSPKSIGNGTR
ncbi:MAG: hypothetical protein RL609_1649 [Bacteroidota bacterium]|jgi:hypothetical protein